MAETKGPDANQSALEDFLRESEAFLAGTMETIVKSAGDDDDAPLIVSHAGAAQEQLGKLTQHVRSEYQRANTDLRREVDAFMQTQAASTLARNGQAALKKVAAKGLFGNGIFAWIESIMHEIKKLFAWLSSMFDWPGWITQLIELLDQIIIAILGLFGGILGRNRSKIMSELSAMEVNFWDELAAHKRYALLGRVDQSEDD